MYWLVIFIGVSNININIDGLNIHYIDEGEGTPVLMLHGWGASVASWRGIIPALSGEHRFIALDFPGCGESDLPTEPMTTDDYARLVVRLLEQLNIKDPIICGHSHGGRVTMYLVGNGMVNPPKIVLLDAAGVKPKKDAKKQIRIYSYKFVKNVLSLPIIKNHSQNLLDKARNYYGSADYNSAPPIMRKTLVNVLHDYTDECAANIKCPTLLLWGDKDTATPLYMAEQLERIIPDTGLCVLKGTGHFSFVEKPYEAIAILHSFLK